MSHEDSCPRTTMNAVAVAASDWSCDDVLEKAEDERRQEADATARDVVIKPENSGQGAGDSEDRNDLFNWPVSNQEHTWRHLTGYELRSTRSGSSRPLLGALSVCGTTNYVLSGKLRPSPGVAAFDYDTFVEITPKRYMIDFGTYHFIACRLP